MERREGEVGFDKAITKLLTGVDLYQGRGDGGEKEKPETKYVVAYAPRDCKSSLWVYIGPDGIFTPNKERALTISSFEKALDICQAAPKFDNNHRLAQPCPIETVVGNPV